MICSYCWIFVLMSESGSSPAGRVAIIIWIFSDEPVLEIPDGFDSIIEATPRNAAFAPASSASNANMILCEYLVS